MDVLRESRKIDEYRNQVRKRGEKVGEKVKHIEKEERMIAKCDLAVS